VVERALKILDVTVKRLFRPTVKRPDEQDAVTELEWVRRLGAVYFDRNTACIGEVGDE
jgi:hypothetical protein